MFHPERKIDQKKEIIKNLKSFLNEINYFGSRQGSRIFKDINKNKCLVKINNQTIIEKIINDAISCGIKNIEVVLGYRSEFVIKVIKKYKSFICDK